MGTVTVRKLDDAVIRDLRLSAAERGVSMEQEARDRLGQPLRETRVTAAADVDTPRWRLKATREEILALGRKPQGPIDHKAESDALFAYIERE